MFNTSENDKFVYSDGLLDHSLGNHVKWRATQRESGSFSTMLDAKWKDLIALSYISLNSLTKQDFELVLSPLPSILLKFFKKYWKIN